MSHALRALIFDTDDDYYIPADDESLWGGTRVIQDNPFGPDDNTDDYWDNMPTIPCFSMPPNMEVP